METRSCNTQKKIFWEGAGYWANMNLILRALRKDKTKFSANSQFTLSLRTAQRQNQALAGGFPFAFALLCAWRGECVYSALIPPDYIIKICAKTEQI